MMTKDSNKISKQEITILFVTGKPEQKDIFENLISGKAYKVGWEENSFNLIQSLKSDETPKISLIVLDKDVKPLGSFQTFDFIRSELELNIPVLIVHDENDHADYKDYEGLDAIHLETSEKSLTKIESFVSPKQDLNEYNPIAYSLNYLKELSDNNEEFISSSLGLFLSSVSERMDEMKKMLSKNKFKKVSKIAHNIKPSFGMIENQAGHEICDYIAHHAKINELPELVEKLDELFVQLKNQLIIDFPSYNAIFQT